MTTLVKYLENKITNYFSDLKNVIIKLESEILSKCLKENLKTPVNIIANQQTNNAILQPNNPNELHNNSYKQPYNPNQQVTTNKLIYINTNKENTYQPSVNLQNQSIHENISNQKIEINALRRKLVDYEIIHDELNYYKNLSLSYHKV